MAAKKLIPINLYVLKDLKEKKAIIAPAISGNEPKKNINWLLRKPIDVLLSS
jgi:hypothetical protein